MSPIEAQAHALLRAWDEAACVSLPSTVLHGGLDSATAYAIGERLRALRIARGERPVGWKIGFTNRSLWARYGVDRPMWAPVYDTTLRLLDGRDATLSLAGLSQPRIEPEIVFGFARAPRTGMTLEALQACVEWVAHGFEIVHTHYDGWRFTAADTAADFALHGRLLVGPRVAVGGWPTLAADLAAMRIELACDGTVKDRGAGTAVLDGPLQALKALVDSMAQITPTWHIAAGDVVTTGTLTDAWPLVPGQQWRTTLTEPRLTGLSLRIE